MKTLIQGAIATIGILATLTPIALNAWSDRADKPHIIDNGRTLWTVERVVDGDTVNVFSGSERRKFRLCGIDSPEKAQPLGSTATLSLKRLIDGQKVEALIVGSDRYGRDVAELWLNDKYVNAHQIRAGMAYHEPTYSKDCTGKSLLAEAENQAKTERLGVWSGAYQRPSDFRKQRRAS